MWLATYLLIKDFITVLTDHVPPQAWDQNLCLGWGNPQAPGWTKHILCPCADVLLKALTWVSYPVQLRFIRMGPQHKTTGDSGVDHFRISLSSFLMKCLVRGKFCLPWFYFYFILFFAFYSTPQQVLTLSPCGSFILAKFSTLSLSFQHSFWPWCLYYSITPLSVPL